MNPLVIIAIGNVVAWGVVVALMFRLGAGERNLKASLDELESRLGDDNMSG